MSQKVVVKILIDRSEYIKLKEYEKEIKQLNEEKKKHLEIVPSEKNSSTEETKDTLEVKNEKADSDQTGSGVLEPPKSSEPNLNEQFIQKISEAVIKQLRQKFKKKHIYLSVIKKVGPMSSLYWPTQKKPRSAGSKHDRNTKICCLVIKKLNFMKHIFYKTLLTFLNF